MKFDFINNDTIAVTGLVIVAIGGLVCKQESIASVAVGAIGGYIGSKALK